MAKIEAIGAAVVGDPVTDLLTVNEEFTASIVIARCRQTPAGPRDGTSTWAAASEVQALAVGLHRSR